MKVAICTGSFDPVTFGHLDVIRRATKLFDKVVVLVAENATKHSLFTAEERCELLRRVTGDMPTVEVEVYGGLMADYARTHGATAIVRGLRAMSDFEYEFQMALTNRKLYAGVETVFLTTSAEYMYLSSSLVKEVARLGGDITEFVPACIVDDIYKKLERTEKK